MRERSGRLGLAERLETEAQLESAFAPLRARRTTVGPTRVRAAVRWGRGGPARPVPWVARVARISELAMAVGFSVFIFAGSLAPAPVDQVPVGEAAETIEVAVVNDILVRRTIWTPEASSPDPADLLPVYSVSDLLDPSRPPPAWIGPQPAGGQVLVAYINR